MLFVMRGLLEYVESKIATPEDTKDESIRKASFLLLTFYTIIPAIVWSGICLYLGLKWAMYIPLIYITVITVMCIPVFFTKKLRSVCIYVQFLFLLLLPILMQLSMGGMKKSGILMLWGILAPLGAAIFDLRRGAVILLLLYITLGVLAVVFDYKFQSLAPMLPNNNRIFFIFNFSLISIALYRIVSYDVHMIQQQRKELEKERNQVSSLLHNILPSKTVVELLEHGASHPNKFNNVTVMFTDLQGFTSVSSRLSPATLIQELNEIYTAFDILLKNIPVNGLKQ